MTSPAEILAKQSKYASDVFWTPEYLRVLADMEEKVHKEKWAAHILAFKIKTDEFDRAVELMPLRVGRTPEGQLAWEPAPQEIIELREQVRSMARVLQVDDSLLFH